MPSYERLPRDLKTVIDNNAGQATAAMAGAMWDVEARAVAETARLQDCSRHRSGHTAPQKRQADRPLRYALTLIRVPSSAPSQILRMTPAAATSKTCIVRPCSLASTKALVSMIRTPTDSASS